jgi:hypothetical protein
MADLYASGENALVTVSSIGGDWSELSGWGSKHEKTAKRPAANKPQVVLSGKHTVENPKTTKMIVPRQHTTLLRKLLDGEDFPDTTVTVQFLDAAGNTDGEAVSWRRCSIAGHNVKDIDVNSSDEVTLEIEWMPGQ